MINLSRTPPSARQVTSGVERIPNPLATNAVSDYLQRLVTRIDDNCRAPTTLFTDNTQKLKLAALTPSIRYASKYLRCSEEAIFASVIYLERIAEKNKKYKVDKTNIFKLSIIAIRVANKFFDDVYYSNKSFSGLLSERIGDFNNMEIEFCEQIGFELFIEKEEYERKKSLIMRSPI
jgi:hypothetical protein